MGKIEELADLAAQWDRRGFAWAAAGGLEDYPREVGRDLDLIVAGRDLPAMTSATVELLRANGWRAAAPPNPWGATWVFGHKDGQDLELDFIPWLNWGPAMLVTSPAGSIRIGPFRVDPWASFAKRTLLRVLSGQAPKPPLGDPTPKALAEPYRRLFGRLLTEDWDTLFGGEAGAIALGVQLRKALLMRCPLRPLQAAAASWRWAKREIRPHFTRCVPIVALTGPEERRRSVIEAAIRMLPATLTGYRVRKGNVAGAGSLSVAMGVLRRWIDLYRRDCPDSSRLRAVFYDGWPGSGDESAPAWAGRLAPRPDIVLRVDEDMSPREQAEVLLRLFLDAFLREAS